jgi:signal transduction histidine kinase
METGASATDLRVLVFAPIGRDGALTVEILERAGQPCHLCRSVLDMCEAMRSGAGVILMTEEALSDAHIDALAATLADQPAWSDISVLLFARDIRAESALRTLRKLEVLRNVTLLDRPVRIAAVISSVQAAIRGRRRQYELRDVLVALEAARTDAERANRLRDEFLATLSHELSTPLNAVLGWVSMLRQSRVNPDELPRILEIIDRNAKVQTQLITDLLDVSRMITGHTRLQLNRQGLPGILVGAVDGVRPAAEARGVALFVDAIDDAALVNADSQRLQQVFWHLLSNAVKFTPSGGRVTLTMRRVDRFVDVAIADTGIGLPSDFLPFAFEPFRQADQTFTRSHGGLGLGLAIVKHLVEMHGGEISAASPGVGSGATFRVRLPVASERPDATGIDSRERSTSTNGPPPVDPATSVSE